MLKWSCLAMLPWRQITGVMLLTSALAAGMPRSAHAEMQYDTLGSSALAIAAYAASKDQCVYSDKLGKALTDIDAFLGRTYGELWQTAKPTGPDKLVGLRNYGRMLRAKSDCVTYGNAIGYIGPVYLHAADLDMEVMAEFGRLLDGKGRTLSGEAEARPDAPPTPGSAAAIMGEYNRQHPDMNRSDDTGNFGSNLKRRPPEVGSSGTPRVPPVPRPQSEPPMQAGGLPDAKDSAAPLPRPPVQDPPPVESLAATNSPSVPYTAPQAKSTPPPLAGAGNCQTAGECRISQPSFACNMDDASRIAEFGPAQGQQIGLEAVKAGKCEVVSAGRLLQLEATKSPKALYATEQGRHVGYLPINVFAPANQGSGTCHAPGFCAVRPGLPIWMCPQADALTLSTPEAKRAAKCLLITDRVGAQVSSGEGDTVTFNSMLGGSPLVPMRYHLLRSELVDLDLQPPPNQNSRGWCRPGEWCAIPVGALFCADRAALERILNLPTTEARRTAIPAERSCHPLIPGHMLKPEGVPAADDPRKLIEVEHPVLKHGWASAKAFKTVSFITPLRFTAQLSDITVIPGRGASLTAIRLSAQGTKAASGTFRAARRERQEFCKTYWGDEPTESSKSCLAEPDEILEINANCEAKQVALNGRRYGLFQRPHDASADIHIDPERKWLFRDQIEGFWLDGTSASGEIIVKTAFDALCPAVNPEAAFGLAYRDPRAEFPRELLGRWFDNRQACADRRRNEPDYDEHGWMVISAEGRVGAREYEWPQRINAVRPLGRGAWEIDASHRIDDDTVPEIFQTSTYRLTRDGFVLRQQGRVSEWVRCR